MKINIIYEVEECFDSIVIKFKDEHDLPPLRITNAEIKNKDKLIRYHAGWLIVNSIVIADGAN